MTFADQLKWIVPTIVMTAAIFVSYEVSLYQDDPTAAHFDLPESPKDGVHICNHDELMKDAAPAPSVHQNYGDQKDAGDIHFQSYDGRSPIETAYSTSSMLSGFNPIRVSFDTQMLYDDARTCFPGVSKVAIGTPPDGTTDCTGGLVVNCWMTCTSDLVFGPAERTRMISDLIPFAKSHFENFLAVKPVIGDLTLGGQVPAAWGSCGNVPDPSASKVNYTKIANTHANTDIVIVVCARPLFGNTLAQAIACQTDPKGRPIAGWIIFRPDKIMQGLPFVRGVMTHELTHALGFSHYTVQPGGTGPTDVSLFINPLTEAKLLVNDVQIALNRTNPTSVPIEEWTVNALKTPTVLSIARDHFNCQTLSGVPLEDQGGPGTASSHWEKRIFQTEYMTGSSPWYPIYSKLTLAFLQDTGFYQVFWNRTDMSHNLKFGYHEGCSFPNVACSEWASTGKPEYWCADAALKGCNFDMSAKGACGLASNGDYAGADFNKRYQYFGSDNPMMGGYDQLPDWCPYLFGYSSYYCEDTVEPASTVSPQPTPKAFGTTYYGETWGAGSLCYESNYIKPGAMILSRSIDVSCHKSACASDTLLKVNIDGFWYDCPASDPGRQITSNTYTGILKCPPAWQNPCGKTLPADPTWPLVSSVIPTSGNAAGGFVVTLIGERFTPGMTMWTLDSQMTNVVVHGPTNATGIMSKVENIKTKGFYPIFIKNAAGKMGTIMFDLSPITVNLNQILDALLNFLTYYAVPLTVASVAGVCAYSVKQEYEELRGNLPQKEYL